MSDEYSENFLIGLQWIWGDGFMSPGGPAEVAEILKGTNLKDKRVLDIGCGIGGIDILLVQQHGAAHVTGTDVDPSLIEKGMQRVQVAGLEDQIDLKLAAPGPLPFPNGSFDVVFSKDAIIHIPDKRAIFTEIKRVLKPNGILAFGDWYGSNLPSTPEFEHWLDVVGLTFEMAPIEHTADLLTEIGFANVAYNDRNQWYAKEIKLELAQIEGENYARLEAAMGPEGAAARLKSSRAKQVAVEQGRLRPGHIRARKEG